MNCLQVEENFSAHYEDALDYKKLRLFDKHISECTSCQINYDRFKDAVKTLQLLPHIEPSPNFIQNLNIRLEDEQREKTPLWKQLLLIVSTPKWAFGGIMVLLLIFAAFTFLYNDGVFNNNQTLNPIQEVVTETRSQNQSFPRALDTPDLFKLPSTQPMQQNYTLKRVSYSTVSTGGGL